ncbi:GTP cyclohydrolase [Flavobacterium sp.]|uniref:GTP cyclohydrolase n=1 Tax=Flavobacterium sp. TaxID=239 RepID=UPI0039E388E0
MITITEAKTKKEMNDFVQFPFGLYKGNPYWIPPIINEELESFDSSVNPAFEHAEAHFFLARKEGKIVGRTAVIVNWAEVNQLGKRKVRFGWFDVIDDIEVTRALLEKAHEMARKHNLDNIEGPMGFSNLDKVGVLTEGFDEIGTMITWYNYPYYKDHFEQLGFVKEKEWLESRFKLPTDEMIAPILKADAMIRRRYNLKAINFTNTKDIMPYVDRMFELFNETYARLSSFVAVSDTQIAYFKKKYIGMINPEYIKFVEDENGKMLAFCIVMPSLSEALQKTKGKLFPFGFLHLLWAKKHTKEVLFYLIGVQPEYQNKGLTAVIMAEYYKSFKANGIETCIRTPELEENNSIQNLWKNFNPVIHKRRRTYIKHL